MKDFAEGFWKATPPGRLLIISIALAIISLALAFTRLVWTNSRISSTIHDVIPRLDARIAAMDVMTTWVALTVLIFVIMLTVSGIWAIILYRKQ